jgi:hypothetical protein
MATYRLYFRDELKGIETADDASAFAVAHMLADACSDRCTDFELWQNTRRVDEFFPKSVTPTAEKIAGAAQQTVIERELAIRASQRVIADSVRLLEQTRRLLNVTRRRAY